MNGSPAPNTTNCSHTPSDRGANTIPLNATRGKVLSPDETPAPSFEVSLTLVGEVTDRESGFALKDLKPEAYILSPGLWQA